jgi:hypothetical protein
MLQIPSAHKEMNFLTMFDMRKKSRKDKSLLTLDISG